MKSWRPVRRTVSSRSQASAGSRVNGFSHITCAPASRAALACSWWNPGGLPMTTMSGRSAMTSCQSVVALREAVTLGDPVEELRVAAVDDREVDLVAVPLEVRKMRADGPGAGTDDAQSKLRHSGPPGQWKRVRPCYRARAGAARHGGTPRRVRSRSMEARERAMDPLATRELGTNRRPAHPARTRRCAHRVDGGRGCPRRIRSRRFARPGPRASATSTPRPGTGAGCRSSGWVPASATCRATSSSCRRRWAAGSSRRPTGRRSTRRRGSAGTRSRSCSTTRTTGSCARTSRASNGSGSRRTTSR